MLGTGFDLFFKKLALGSEAAVGYHALYRPAVTESESPTALELDSRWYRSIPGTISFHASYLIYEGISNCLQMELSAGYRRELTAGTLRTTAAFRGYSSYTFTSEDSLCASDRFQLNETVRLFSTDGFSAALTLNEQFGSALYTITGGIHFSRYF